MPRHTSETLPGLPQAVTLAGIHTADEKKAQALSTTRSSRGGRYLVDHGHTHGGGECSRFRHGYQSGSASTGSPAAEADQMACSTSSPSARARMIASRMATARPRGPRLSVSGDPGVWDLAA